ncbi:MAG: nuclear transport factor 2 family protein [Gammaproteobacteria bacterium]|nr:nuclear transport factor 2 family protein [Gammaproteobacteria bacterium]MCY3796009.1 nuclear transport factor 2 family protein [Gammaproteobacteria bacterium]
MTYAIDPHQSWLALEAAAAQESSARRKALITEVRNHMEHEIKGQLDPLMDTLTAHPVYHFWGSGEPSVIEGRDAVRAFYAGMFQTGGQQFEVVVDKVVASDDHVITEGQVKQVYKGEALLAMEVAKVGDEEVQAGDFWLGGAQLVTLWPADADGKLIGEDIYFGASPFANLKKIGPSDLPPYFQL